MIKALGALTLALMLVTGPVAPRTTTDVVDCGDGGFGYCGTPDGEVFVIIDSDGRVSEREARCLVSTRVNADGFMIHTIKIGCTHLYAASEPWDL